MKIVIQCLLFTLLLASAYPANAQGTTAFTYQGQLRDGGTNANGAYTMNFKLYDAVAGGNQVGGTLTLNNTLANGLFSVDLDFGSAFNGSARWLEITVAGDTLAPRVQVLPSPYAQFAAVAATVTNGAITSAQIAANAVATGNIQNNAISTAQIANGAITTPKIADANVTDVKIVSLSGSKVIGAVASATLANSVAAGAITTPGLQDSAVTAAKIASGQAVKSLNGLADAVTLSAGQNVSLTPSGNDIQISATLTNSSSLSLGTWHIADQGGVLVFSPGGVKFAANGQVGFFNRVGLNGNTLDDVSTIIGSGGVLNIAGCINGSFCQPSDKNLKEQFSAIDSRAILERVSNLPISSWNYKTDGHTRHIGPMAQDFYTAFNVGTDDKHINTVDESGVALAAIQGLNIELKAKDAQIQALEKRLADLEQVFKTSAQK